MRSALMPGYTAYGNRIHLDAIRIGRNAYVGEQSRARHRLGDRRLRPARPRLVAAARPARAGRQALRRLAGRGDDDDASGSPTRRPARPAPARALHRGPARFRPRGRRRADRGGRHLSDERADRRRRRARAEAAGTRSSPCCRWRRRRRSASRSARWSSGSSPSTPFRGSPTCSSRKARSIRSTASTTACSRSSRSSATRAFFNLMFGDLVFIKPYLRWVGWTVGVGEETGSNFGSRAGPGQSVPVLGRRQTRSPPTACGSAT